MGLLLARLSSLIDLKAGFEAEDRLVDMQEEYLQLLGGYQGLEREIKVGRGHFWGAGVSRNYRHYCFVKMKLRPTKQHFSTEMPFVKSFCLC